MEHKIGKAFKHRGLKIKAQIVPEDNYCKGCILYGTSNCLSLREFCSYNLREDGNEVIYVKAE